MEGWHRRSGRVSLAADRGMITGRSSCPHLASEVDFDLIILDVRLRRHQRSNLMEA